MPRTYNRIIRIVALFLSVAFFAQELSYAAPLGSIPVGAIHESPLRSILENPSLFEPPSNFCNLKEIYGANRRGDPSGRPYTDLRPLIIHIQDAHSNLSGQQNLASTLDEIAKKYFAGRGGVTPPLQVLVEGGAHEGTLTPLREILPQDSLKTTARKLLLEGQISGEEYLNLTSNHPMRILGIEDIRLYAKSLKSYGQLADKREKILEYLNTIQKAVEKLKKKLYPKELLDYEKIKSQDNFEKRFEKLIGLFNVEERFAAPSSSNALVEDHPNRMIPAKNVAGMTLDAYPSLQQLKTLQAQEKLIDFNLANLEQAALLEEMGKKGIDWKAIRHPEERSDEGSQQRDSSSPLAPQNDRLNSFSHFRKIFNIAHQKNIDLSKYPNLMKYEEYLKEFTNINLEQVLNEMEKLEDEVYQKYLGSNRHPEANAEACLPARQGSQDRDSSKPLASQNDGLLIRSIDRYLKLLDTAYRIQMTTGDFKTFQANEPDFSTVSYLAFLNRKMAEQGFFEDLIPYKNILEQGKKALIDFYDFVNQRDLAFMQNTERILGDQQNRHPEANAEGSHPKVVIMITGGYHTQHLKQLFREKGYSYIVLAPNVTQETNQTKYEKLLLSPLKTETKKIEIIQGEEKSNKPLSVLEKDLMLEKKKEGIRKTMFELDPMGIQQTVEESGARLSEAQEIQLDQFIKDAVAHQQEFREALGENPLPQTPSGGRLSKSGYSRAVSEVESLLGEMERGSWQALKQLLEKQLGYKRIYGKNHIGLPANIIVGHINVFYPDYAFAIAKFFMNVYMLNNDYFRINYLARLFISAAFYSERKPDFQNSAFDFLVYLLRFAEVNDGRFYDFLYQYFVRSLTHSEREELRFAARDILTAHLSGARLAGKKITTLKGRRFFMKSAAGAAAGLGLMLNPGLGALAQNPPTLTDQVRALWGALSRHINPATGVPTSMHVDNPLDYWNSPRYNQFLSELQTLLQTNYSDPELEVKIRGAIDRSMALSSTNVYDLALWLIAAVATKNKSAVDVVVNILKNNRFGEQDIRMTRGLIYGDRVLPERNAFVNASFQPTYYMADPHYSEGDDRRLYLPGFPDSPNGRIKMVDYRAALGENAWLFFIGLTQAAHFLYTDQGQSIPLNSDIMNLIIDVLPAVEALQSRMGGVYYAPQGTFGADKREMSGENNISILAGLEMFKQIAVSQGVSSLVTRADRLISGVEVTLKALYRPKMKLFLRNGFYDELTGSFETTISPDKDPEEKDYKDIAVDVNTWAIAFLGPERVDRLAGSEGASLEIWNQLKARAGYLDENGQFAGFGFKVGSHNRFSPEWSLGGWFAAYELYQYLEAKDKVRYQDELAGLQRDMDAIERTVERFKDSNGGVVYVSDHTAIDFSQNLYVESAFDADSKYYGWSEAEGYSGNYTRFTERLLSKINNLRVTLKPFPGKELNVFKFTLTGNNGTAQYVLTFSKTVDGYRAEEAALQARLVDGLIMFDIPKNLLTGLNSIGQWNVDHGRFGNRNPKNGNIVGGSFIYAPEVSGDFSWQGHDLSAVAGIVWSIFQKTRFNPAKLGGGLGFQRVLLDRSLGSRRAPIHRDVGNRGVTPAAPSALAPEAPAPEAIRQGALSEEEIKAIQDQKEKIRKITGYDGAPNGARLAWKNGNQEPEKSVAPAIVTELIENAVREFPDQTLEFISGLNGEELLKQTLTYRTLNERSNQFANALLANGLASKDCVATMLPNAQEAYIAAFGTWKAGGILTPLKEDFRGERLKRQLTETNTKFVILFEDYLPHLMAVIDRLPDLKTIVVVKRDGAISAEKMRAGVGNIIVWDNFLNTPKDKPVISIDPSDTVAIFYTSGSNSISLGIEVSHANVSAADLQTARWIQEQGLHGPVAMVVSASGTYGFRTLLAGMLEGRKVVMVNVSTSQIEQSRARLLAEAVRKEKVSILFGTPSVLYDISKEAKSGNIKFPDLKIAISRGAKLNLETQKFIQDKLGISYVFDAGGMTEASAFSYNSIGAYKIGSIGRPNPGVEVKVVHPDTGSDLGIDKTGELLIRAPQVMKGYWKRPHETERSFTPDGWLRTGDIARIDNEGYITIVGRKKNIIRSGGVTIVPDRVEEILLQHENIKEAAVVGISDPLWFSLIGDREGQTSLQINNEIAVAYVVCENESFDEQAVKNFLRQYLRPGEIPQRFIIVNRLPRLGSYMKVDRKKLQEPYYHALVSKGDGNVSNLENVLDKAAQLSENQALSLQEILKKLYESDNFPQFDEMYGDQSSSAARLAIRSQNDLQLINRTQRILADTEVRRKLSTAQIYQLNQAIEKKLIAGKNRPVVQRIIENYGQGKTPTYTAAQHDTLIEQAREVLVVFSSDPKVSRDTREISRVIQGSRDLTGASAEDLKQLENILKRYSKNKNLNQTVAGTRLSQEQNIPRFSELAGARLANGNGQKPLVLRDYKIPDFDLGLLKGEYRIEHRGPSTTIQRFVQFLEMNNPGLHVTRMGIVSRVANQTYWRERNSMQSIDPNQIVTIEWEISGIDYKPIQKLDLEDVMALIKDDANVVREHPTDGNGYFSAYVIETPRHHYFLRFHRFSKNIVNLTVTRHTIPYDYPIYVQSKEAQESGQFVKIPVDYYKNTDQPDDKTKDVYGVLENLLSTAKKRFESSLTLLSPKEGWSEEEATDFLLKQTQYTYLKTLRAFFRYPVYDYNLIEVFRRSGNVKWLIYEGKSSVLGRYAFMKPVNGDFLNTRTIRQTLFFMDKNIRAFARNSETKLRKALGEAEWDETLIAYDKDGRYPVSYLPDEMMIYFKLFETEQDTASDSGKLSRESVVKLPFSAVHELHTAYRAKGQDVVASELAQLVEPYLLETLGVSEVNSDLKYRVKVRHHLLDRRLEFWLIPAGSNGNGSVTGARLTEQVADQAQKFLPAGARFAETPLTRKEIDRLPSEERVLVENLAAFASGSFFRGEGLPKPFEILIGGVKFKTQISFKKTELGIDVLFSNEMDPARGGELISYSVSVQRIDEIKRVGISDIAERIVDKKADDETLKLLSVRHEADRLDRFAMGKVLPKLGLAGQTVIVRYVVEDNFESRPEKFLSKFKDDIQPVKAQDNVFIQYIDRSGKLLETDVYSSDKVSEKNARIVIVGNADRENIALAKAQSAALLPVSSLITDPQAIPVMANQANLVLAVGTALLEVDATTQGVKNTPYLEFLAQLHSQLVNTDHRAFVLDNRTLNFWSMKLPVPEGIETLQKLSIEPIAKLRLDELIKLMGARLASVGSAA